jgi:hypothetical protein
MARGYSGKAPQRQALSAICERRALLHQVLPHGRIVGKADRQ